MPPYPQVETPGRVGSPKRREIGHGALAELLWFPVLPKPQKSSHMLFVKWKLLVLRFHISWSRMHRALFL